MPRLRLAVVSVAESSPLDGLIERIFMPAIDPGYIFSELSNGKFRADPWQARILASDAKLIGLTKPRRCGGSELVINAIGRTMMAGGNCIVCGPGERHTIELGKRLRHKMSDYATSGRPGAELYRPVNSGASKLILANGAECVFMPNNPDMVRGKDIDAVIGVDGSVIRPGGLVVWDEVAFTEEAEELWRVLAHVVSDPHNRMIAVTTAGYVDTWPHRLFTGQVPGWELHHVSVADAARTYTPEREAMARLTAGDGAPTELDGVWRTNDGQAFLFGASEIDDILGYESDYADADVDADNERLETAKRLSERRKFSSIWTPGRGLFPLPGDVDETTPTNGATSARIPAQKRPKFSLISD